jgi:hypothetical protein
MNRCLYKSAFSQEKAIGYEQKKLCCMYVILSSENKVFPNHFQLLSFTPGSCTNNAVN